MLPLSPILEIFTQKCTETKNFDEGSKNSSIITFCRQSNRATTFCTQSEVEKWQTRVSFSCQWSILAIFGLIFQKIVLKLKNQSKLKKVRFQVSLDKKLSKNFLFCDHSPTVKHNRLSFPNSLVLELHFGEKKTKNMTFFGLWAKVFRTFSKKFSGLSKLYSTCPKEHFD